jgi:four helix bundle protein
MNGIAHNFRELAVWKRARKLVKAVYLLTSFFPRTEQFGLTSQVRRSVVSIPSNIAEGAGRASDREFIRFLSSALASAFELETQLLLAEDLNFLQSQQVEEVADELRQLQKMLVGLQRHLDSAPDLKANF